MVTESSALGPLRHIQMPHTTQNAIVTGAAGFIGSHLGAALLQRGISVTAVDNFDPFYDPVIKRRNLARILREQPHSPARFELVEGDIRNASLMRDIFVRTRPHAVFHIAALAGVRPSIADPARYASVNVEGVVSVLDAARAANCRTIVFASSSSVYGDNRTVPFAESDAVDEPLSPYAATKRAGELICHAYAHLFKLRIAALRFFTVYGPAQRPDLAISKFMRLISLGEEVPMYGDGSSSRDYTFIQDIVEGVIRAYDKLRAVSDSSPGDGFFRIYNLGNSHPVSLAHLIESIAAVVGKPARIKRHPMQPGDVQQTWADLARSASELGYCPRTKFEDGLHAQWRWLQESLANPDAASAPISDLASTRSLARDGG